VIVHVTGVFFVSYVSEHEIDPDTEFPPAEILIVPVVLEITGPGGVIDVFWMVRVKI
jgi:hypothetical protein